MKISSFIRPEAYVRRFFRALDQVRLKVEPNMLGALHTPPGTFYSPLLDLAGLEPGQNSIASDGEEYWEFFQFKAAEQKALYESLVASPDRLEFPEKPNGPFRYCTENDYFPLPDAFLLSGMLQAFKPKQVVEVGSGFSSAVMLDTRDRSESLKDCRLTFVEPYPDRLSSLMRAADPEIVTIIEKPVQEVPLDLFESLNRNDILFVDSSHVAKIGSDVTFLILRILPRLKPGVLVHFHDIVYPHSYPIEWIRRGLAWNESIFLRAYLAENPHFECVAFNSYAAKAFPDLFDRAWPQRPESDGGSLWLRRC